MYMHIFVTIYCLVINCLCQVGSEGKMHDKGLNKILVKFWNLTHY